MTPAAQAARFVGVPYVLLGDDPVAGWDCRGCVRHVRREVFGLESPGFENIGYRRDEAACVEDVERLMLIQRVAWREVETPIAGAVLLFRYFGRDCHVGLALNPAEFIHCLMGQETTIVRLENWRRRLRGAYVTLD